MLLSPSFFGGLGPHDLHPDPAITFIKSTDCGAPCCSWHRILIVQILAITVCKSRTRRTPLGVVNAVDSIALLFQYLHALHGLGQVPCHCLLRWFTLVLPFGRLMLRDLLVPRNGFAASLPNQLI